MPEGRTFSGGSTAKIGANGASALPQRKRKKVGPSRKSADQIRKEILEGKEFDAPQERSRVVRIFLSSTFHDFIHERNYLFKNALPELESWCRKQGIEFQVADMRWGIRDNATVEHGGGSMCLEEVRHCRKLSIGPNFVALIGNRYGHRPLPTVIPEHDYDVLTENMTGMEHSMINEWYLKNCNHVPPEYLLRSIDSVYPHYMNREEEELRLADRKKWAESESQLRKIIDKSVKTAVNQHKLDKVHSYIASITEQEIWEGVMNADEPERSALCFMRHFTNIDDTAKPITGNKARKYIDLDKNGNRNATAKEMLETFTNFQLPMNLDDLNIIRYSLEFDPKNGINPTDPKHAQYLRELNAVFERRIKDMITNALSQSNGFNGNDTVYHESLQHSQFALAKSQLFCGRDSTLDWLYSTLANQQVNGQPLILYGESGVGKTATVAKIILDAYKCIDSKPYVLYRFLGTTPDSSSLDTLLRSLSAQICSLYGLKTASKEQEGDFNVLKPFFYSVLQQVETVRTRPPLVIILDSVDKLSPAFGAHLTSWIPATLPSRVTILLSIMPGYQQILTRLQARFRPIQFLELTQESNETGSAVLSRLLAQANRTLQPEQMSAVEEVMSQSQTPLLLHLTVNEAREWKSFTPVDELKLGASARDAVHVLFDRLEKQHGKILISHALAYLVAAKNGLSEQEMEEVLSLDNEVLNDVYQYWAPPATDELRVPPLVWANVKQDMTEFIMSRRADDSVVLALYHKQFTEVVMQRYLTTVTKPLIHKNLAEFFQGTWARRPKPAHLKILNGEKRFLWRRVRSQPYKFGEGRYNLRKLNELPYHLVRSDDADEALDREVFLNYEYLCNKLEACGMPALLSDFDAYQQTGAVPEYSCIRQALRLAKPTLEFDNAEDILATELIGRMKLLAQKYAGISSLIEQAVQSCSQTLDKTLMIPQNQCFMAPNGVLVATLFGHKAGLTSLACSDDANVVITASKDKTIRICDLDTDIVLHDILLKDVPEIVLIDDDRDRIFIGDSQGGVHIYEAKTGSVLDQWTCESIDARKSIKHEHLDFPDLNLDFDTLPRRPFTGFSCITNDGTLVIARDTQVLLFNARQKPYPVMKLESANHAKISFVQEAENTLLVGFGKNSLVEVVPKHRSHKLLAFAERAQLIGACYTSGKQQLMAVANQAPKGGACLLQVPIQGTGSELDVPSTNQTMTISQASAILCDFLCEVHRTTIAVAGPARIKVMEIGADRPVTTAGRASSLSTRSNVSCKSVFSALLPSRRMSITGNNLQNGVDDANDLELKMSRTICCLKLMPRKAANEKLQCPLLLVGCEDETIRIYDLELRTLRNLLSGVWGPPDLINFTSKGMVFTASTCAPFIKVWNLEAQIAGDEFEEDERVPVHTIDDSSPVIVESFVAKPVFLPTQDAQSVFTAASLGAEPNCISIADARGITRQVVLDHQVRGFLHLFDAGRSILYGDESGKIHWLSLQPNSIKAKRQTSSQSVKNGATKNEDDGTETDNAVVATFDSPVEKYSYHSHFDTFVLLLENQTLHQLKIEGSQVSTDKLQHPKPNSKIVDLCYTEEGLVLLYKNESAMLVTLGKGKAILKFQFRAYLCQAMCTRNEYLVACVRDAYTMDKVIQIWNLDEKKVKRIIEVKDFQVSCVELTTDCKYMLLGAGRVEYNSSDARSEEMMHRVQQRQIRIYSIIDGSLLRNKVYMYSPVTQIQCFHGDMVGVVMELGYIGFFKLQVGTLRYEPNRDKKSVTSINSLKLNDRKTSATSSKSCTLL